MTSAEFEHIYSTYKSKVYNTVLSYVQLTEDAEEITQDVFVEIFRSIDHFKGDSSLSTWIYRIAINKSLDFIKYRNRKKRFALFSSLFQAKTGSLFYDKTDFNHPGITLENKEKAKFLFKAIDYLPENQKTAFILFQIEDLSYKQISDIMQLSESAIESLLHRARSNLKKRLRSFYKG